MIADDISQRIVRAWQTTEEEPMTIDTIRERAAAFDRRSRRHAVASIAAFAAIIVANAITFAVERSAVEKAGDLWTIGAALYVLLSYWRVRDASPTALGVTPSLDLYRSKIVRRQAMIGRWRIVVLLFVPGIVLSTVGDGFVSPQPPLRYASVAAAFAALLAWVEWLNRREARRLSDELDRLDR